MGLMWLSTTICIILLGVSNVGGGRSASQFPNVTDIQEEVKTLLLQKKLENLHAADFGFLPLAIHYAFQQSVLSDLSGTKLASVVRANTGDTTLAYKTAAALYNRTEQQNEYLQSLGSKIYPDVQKIIIRQVLNWWGDPNMWKDRELSLLTSSGDPLLAYLPPAELETLDDELADRFTSILGQANEIGKFWWSKPMSLKKAWFELAKGARYFGAVHEWSFRRMQQLSFLLEGAAPEDLEMIPPIPEIKGLVIGNSYTELQCRVVFDAFYRNGPLSQEDLQEFQFHVLNLTPTQLQRFDLADSFSTLDEMINILDKQKSPPYPTLLQISYFIWPLVNSSSGGLTIAPPTLWQKRELSQMGKFLFLLPKSTLFQIPQDLINWDSNILQAIRSPHLSFYQIWYLTSQMLKTIDDRFKPDYVFMIPSPFPKGIPAVNMSQILLGSPVVRPEILRALTEESSDMLLSQKAVIVQRLRNRLGESTTIRNILSSARPYELFNFFNPRTISKSMPNIIKTIMEMPETGRFGITSIQAKLLPTSVLSLWLNGVRENAQLTRWTAEDILGRSALGAAHEINLAVLGLTCRDIDIIGPLDILPIVLHYRHELYNLRRYQSELSFSLNLRPCILAKVLEYLKLKSTLNGTQTDSHILTGLNYGEIAAIGGEVLTVIPTTALRPVPIPTQTEIIEEIGGVEMMELFSICTLSQLQWYANTLVRNIHIHQVHHIRNMKKRDTHEESLQHLDGPDEEYLETNAEITPKPDVNSVQLNLNTEFYEKMGNLLCYASEIDIGKWSKQPFKDIMETKTLPGEKTCCMHATTRAKWFTMLQEAYGSDTTSWSEYELASIGDLLIVVPDHDLQKISIDSLSKAFSPIMHQSGYHIKLTIPGMSEGTPFINACVEQLGTEGLEFLDIYKGLMRKYFQAAQWMVNTVKTTNELIKEGMGRSGRVPRWADFKLVRKPRQIIMTTGTTTGQTQSAAAGSPTMLVFPQPSQTFSQQPQIFSQQPQTTFSQTPQTFSQAGASTIPAASASATAGALAPSIQQMMSQFTTPNQNFQTGATGPALSFQTAPSPSSGLSFQTAPSPTSGMTFQSQGATSSPYYQTTAQTYPATPVYLTSAPAYQTNVPAYQPNVPAYQPNVPAYQTNVPAYQTNVPAYQPNVPAYQPNVPAYQTNVPIYQASVPSYQTSFPTYQASVPAYSGAPSYPATYYPTVSSPSYQDPNTAYGTQSQTIDFQQQFTNPQQQFPASSSQQPIGVVQQFLPAKQQFGVTQQIPATQQAGANQYGVGQQFPATQQQQFPATQQQFADPQQFPASQQQFPDPQQFPGNQQQPQAQQQFSDSQQFPNSQQTQQFPSGQQPVGQPPFPPNQQQFQPNQQQFSNAQQFGNQQQQKDSSQGFGQVPGFNADGTVVQNPALFPRDLNETEQQLSNKPDIVNINSNKEILSKINLGSLQKSETEQNEITCHGIKTAGPAAIGLTMDDLQKLSVADLFNCIEPLGALDWDENIKRSILNLITEKLFLTTERINTRILIEMGELVRALPVSKDDHIPNDDNTTAPAKEELNISRLDLTLPTSLDDLSILGSKITKPAALKALAEKFNTDNKIFPGFAQGIARPDNLRIVVISLKNILCGFSDKIVNSIFESDPSLFIDACYTLGKLEGCSLDVITTLASHAVRSSNYGPPRLWSQEDIDKIGVVFAGLKPEAIATVPPVSMGGLPPHAVKALTPAAIQALTPEQLERFSYSAASALSPAQKNELTESQLNMINKVLVIQADEFDIAVREEIIDEPVNDASLTPEPEVEREVKDEPIETSEGNRPGLRVAGHASGAPTLKGRSSIPKPISNDTTASEEGTITTTEAPTDAAKEVGTTPAPTSSGANSNHSYQYKDNKVIAFCTFFMFSILIYSFK